jgi:hypothetical protein
MVDDDVIMNSYSWIACVYCYKKGGWHDERV